MVGDADPHLAGFEAPAMKVSAVAVPVLINDDVVGVIEVVKIGLNQYSRVRLRLLRSWRIRWRSLWPTPD